MAEQHKEPLINTPFIAAKLTVAAMLLLRIGGYGGGLLPPPAASLALLLALLVAGRIAAQVSHSGGAATRAHWRGWARDNAFALTLAAITLAGLALRLFGANRDLGHVALGIDENRLNVSILHLFRTGEIDYRTVEHYPGIHYWMLTGTYLIAYLWGLMSDVAETLARMPREHFVAFGRAVSALQSGATVLLVGLLGRRLAGPRTGLLAALILALAPLSVSLGRQLRNDAAQTMLVVAAVLVALGIRRHGFASWEPALGGALAGLAAGVKYTGVFALLPLLLAAVVSRERARRGSALGLVMCGFFVAALLSNHFVWADLPNLVDQLSDQILITGEGHWAAQDNPAAYHVRILAQRVVGWPLMVVAAAAVAYGLASANPRWWVFALYPLTYIWFVAQRPSQLPRWVYPAAPFAAVAAAAGLVAVIDFVIARRAALRATAVPRPALAALLAVAFLSPLLLTATMLLSRQLTPPTWEVAERWLEGNAAPGDRILLQNNWLQLDRDRMRLNRQRSLAAVLGGGRYELAANDWIVVHEELLSHEALDELELRQRIAVEPTFFGNQGPNFAIYAPAPVADAAVPMEVRLDDRAARPYLGHEWPRPEGATGRRLPGDGARLFLPPLGGRSLRLDVVAASTVTAEPVGLAIAAGDTDLGVQEVATAADGTTTFTADIPLSTVGPGVVELILRPEAAGAPLFIVGFRLY